MIDALAGPGTAVDIRISTLEPVQQLRMHFANVLSAELSRMRADTAFASVTGSAVQAPATQDDHLRAQQRSVLGQIGVSLRSNGATLAETTTLAEHFVRADSDDVSDADVDANGYGVERRADDGHRDDSDEESVAALHADTLLISALRSALTQFKAVAEAAEFSGSPLVLALPAQRFLKAHAPADLRCSADAAGGKDQMDVLVLCLAFDGSIGAMRTVLGVLFRQDLPVAQLNADRVEAVGCGGETLGMTIAQPNSLVSDVSVDGVLGRMSGIRVKLDDMAAEPAHWSWQVRQWSWL